MDTSGSIKDELYHVRITPFGRFLIQWMRKTGEVDIDRAIGEIYRAVVRRGIESLFNQEGE